MGSSFDAIPDHDAVGIDRFDQPSSHDSEPCQSMRTLCSIVAH
jgi:hypothetical protein